MKYLIKLFLVLNIVIIQNLFSQSTVYVQTNQFGRGILKTRGSDCFVITPEHLLKDYFGPISVFGKGNEQSRAELLKAYAGDLAILKFDGDHNQNCKKWQLHQSYGEVIENIYEGYVELREKDGSSSKFAVNITGIDVQYIFIRPKDFREKFYQGMSGSSLFVEYQGRKVFLGMLQSIADDENGSVIRADEMDKLLGAFFNPIIKKKVSKVLTDKNLTKEVKDFKFDLLNISKSGDRVTFTLDVTSLKADKSIHFMNRDISLYEDNGTEIRAKTIIIGNKTSGYGIDYNLIKNVPVAMNFIFEGIASSSKYASAFKIGFSQEKIKSSFEYGELYYGDETEDITAVIEKNGNWSKEELGFKYELLNIEKKGTNVDFTFSITSLNKDKVIRFLLRNIVLYDNNGLETKSSKILLGNKIETYSINYNLVSSIKVPLIISFKNVASSATGVSLLKVGFSDTQNEGLFQIRNLTFPENSNLKANDTNNSIVGKPSTNCSEIYFYRKTGMLECPETVYLYNHGELLAKFTPGVRFKSLVCDDRSFKLTVKLRPNDLALQVKRPQIDLGKKYYFKINCAVGVPTISIQESKKGAKDITNSSKFKRKLINLPLTNY